MLAKAFENGQSRGLILKTVQADWRWLNRDIQGKYDAIICLGNSFTHLHEEQDRRRALAEFYAALKHDGILILDQRNYDAILDHGFKSKHKYYYCGDKVTAEPEHIDDGLARFKYTFPDGAEYTLNLCPIRKNYMRRLLQEAGFERVRTYGDFQETYAEDEPDFFIHVAEKSALHLVRWGGGTREQARPTCATCRGLLRQRGRRHLLRAVWGGEDLHVGCYDDTRDIREAIRRDRRPDGRDAAEARPDSASSTSAPAMAARCAGVAEDIRRHASPASTSPRSQNDTNRLRNRRTASPTGSAWCTACSRTSPSRTPATTWSGARTRSCIPTSATRCWPRCGGC